ncbi:MAG: 16S rRNA (cytidine(1402)-2'-O)-methyltransferase [Candidatus Levybacteria bacterium]|nr:16S rRNA (cytidine(1402)-2'-O)-methyltransferase [Candidatus Levybacteria bacterium]
MGILYIVATPIGNLEDITIRAIRTLLTVDGIACEDTRKAGFLLKTLRARYSFLVVDGATSPVIARSEATKQSLPAARLPAGQGRQDQTDGIATSRQGGTRNDNSNQIPTVRPVQDQRLLSYYEQNEDHRIPEIINALINDLNIALISDAGTPLISDPGFRLVRECIKQGIKVQAIPGPSSVLAALVSSGLPPDKFLFVGYPPRKPGHRIKFYENIKKSQEYVKATCILFEAPHKLVKTLEEMQSVFGDIEIVVARELTKVHEEVRKIAIAEAVTLYKKQEPRGECVILFSVQE